MAAKAQMIDFNVFSVAMHGEIDFLVVYGMRSLMKQFGYDIIHCDIRI